MKSNYIFSKTVQLNHTLKLQCDDLYNKCCNSDNLKHSYCLEDEFDILPEVPRLYYVNSNEQLLGFLSVYIIDSNSVEISIFVHPDRRRKHIGQQLLGNFLDDYKISNIEISVHPDNLIGIDFLKKNNFSYVSTELLMSVQLKTFTAPENSSNFELITGNSSQYHYVNKGIEIVSCDISKFNDEYIFISNVETLTKYRGKGYGHQFLQEVLYDLSHMYTGALLHVSKENTPAYNLYRKLGFQINDSTVTYTLHQ